MSSFLIYLYFDSPEAVEATCDQRRFWSDCADAQADLSRRWLQLLLQVLLCIGYFYSKESSLLILKLIQITNMCSEPEGVSME